MPQLHRPSAIVAIYANNNNTCHDIGKRNEIIWNVKAWSRPRSHSRSNGTIVSGGAGTRGERSTLRGLCPPPANLHASLRLRRERTPHSIQKRLIFKEYARNFLIIQELSKFWKTFNVTYYGTQQCVRNFYQYSLLRAANFAS